MSNVEIRMRKEVRMTNSESIFRASRFVIPSSLGVSSSSLVVLSSSLRRLSLLFKFNVIEQCRAIGVDRFLVRVKRGGRFGAVADGDE